MCLPLAIKCRQKRVPTGCLQLFRSVHFTIFSLSSLFFLVQRLCVVVASSFVLVISGLLVQYK